MKTKQIFYKIVILLLFYLPCAGQFNSTLSDAKAMLKTIEKLHIDYREIDNSSSEYIFQSTLESIDRYGLFYTTEDIHLLDPFKSTIAKQIQDESPEFLNELKSKLIDRQKEAKEILLEFKSKTLDYENLDTFFYSEKNVFASQAAKSEKWKRWVKLMTLNDYLDQLDSNDEASIPDAEKMNGLKDSVIEEQIKLLTARIEKEELNKNKIKNSFLSSVAKAFDPHTNYFSPQEREEFDESLSATKITYGIELRMNDDNEIEIASIIPGSAAWSSDEFQEGDIILSFKPKGKKEVQFSNISLAQANSYLNSDKIDAGMFKLKRASGQQETISLIKTSINNEDNIINSYLLEQDKKIAYVSLPSFYLNQETHNGCANDIARELIQLKKEGIEGLIFDLRGNGGGSMEEALKLCGMFINYGALFIFKYREGDPETIKDINKGSVYDGPMIVLVDKSSCSAAELFAAVMQDYNRALIVGGDTYGKSTSQAILPLTASSLMKDEPKPDLNQGFLKLTIGKLYRCTGKSYQREGVKVDISLPDIYKHLELGEIHEPRALNATPIDKKTYYYPLPALPIDLLKNKSAERLQQNKRYQDMDTYFASQAIYIHQKWIPLQFQAYKKFKNAIESADKTSFQSDTTGLEVKIPNYVSDMGKLPETNRVLREKRCSDLKEDLNILEAYYIINDLNLSTK